jgi:hypothetical protein
MNLPNFSHVPQKGPFRPSQPQITIENHSKSLPHQSPQRQSSFPAHGKVPEGQLPSHSLLPLATRTTTPLAFPSAACFRTPSPLYPNSVPFPATPLPPRHIRPVARTIVTSSDRLPPRRTDPLILSARFPVKEEATTGIGHNYILDHSRLSAGASGAAV